ncbi:MAG: hypothetical protein ACYS91_07840 [Planctomycetota bacterium]
MMVGRKIRWDAQTEKIIDDSATASMLNRSMRAPWRL